MKRVAAAAVEYAFMIVDGVISTEKAYAPAVARWGYGRGLLAAVALAVLGMLFFALTARDGIISTNDGSHYALTKALATSVCRLEEAAGLVMEAHLATGNTTGTAVRR